jgi:hypothetical protein
LKLRLSIDILKRMTTCFRIRRRAHPPAIGTPPPSRTSWLPGWFAVEQALESWVDRHLAIQEPREGNREQAGKWLRDRGRLLARALVGNHLSALDASRLPEGRGLPGAPGLDGLRARIERILAESVLGPSPGRDGSDSPSRSFRGDLTDLMVQYARALALRYLEALEPYSLAAVEREGILRSLLPASYTTAGP